MWQIIVKGLRMLISADRVEVTTTEAATYTDIRITKGSKTEDLTFLSSTDDVRIVPPAEHTLKPMFPGVPDHPALDYNMRI